MGKAVVHASVALCQAVADGDGVELNGLAAGLEDALLDFLSELTQGSWPGQISFQLLAITINGLSGFSRESTATPAEARCALEMALWNGSSLSIALVTIAPFLRFSLINRVAKHDFLLTNDTYAEIIFSAFHHYI